MKKDRVKIIENIAFHLLPGILTLVIFVLLGVVFKSAPTLFRLNVSLLLGYFPIGIYIMKISTTHKKPYITIRNLTPYLKRVSFNEFLLFSLGGFFVVFLLNIVLSPRLEFFMVDAILLKLPEWLSSIFVYSFDAGKVISVMILLLNLILVGFIKPIFDGIYFRGMLLGEVKELGPICILISATFYAICHMFSPNLILVMFVLGLIFSAVTYYKKNIYISIVTNLLFALSVNIALFTSLF